MPKRRSVDTLNPYENPEDEPHIVSFARNEQYAKPGYQPTQLQPGENVPFNVWASLHPQAVRGEMTPDADYDIKGYWRAQQAGDPLAVQAGNNHYPDKWKTPYSGVFSNESMYAKPNAPRWQGNSLYTDLGRKVTGQ